MKRISLAMITFFVLVLANSWTLAQTEYQKPALTENDAWSMILIPDPQSYVKFERNQPIYDLMVAWIAENIDPLKIGLVLCTGDLVERNNVPGMDGKEGNQNSIQQWTATSKALKRLDGRAPYIIVPGNHDYGIRSAENRESKLNQFFPADGNDSAMGLLIECGSNAFGEKTLENAAYEYVSPAGQKYLVFALEFAPRDEIINWAKEIAARPEYENHFGIVLTHSYLSSNNKRISMETGYKIQVEGTNCGQTIWEKLVYPSKNIRLVLCGHISGPDDFNGCVGYAKEKNESGKMVHQMLFDTQALGGGWHGNGGDGWLQILEFSADGQRISVRTFSPLFAASPSTRNLAWNREPYAEFIFDVDAE